MVDLDVIKKRGGTTEELAKKFAANAVKPGSKIDDLIQLSACRINDGVQNNLQNARIFWAIDRAFDVSHRQITYTLVEGLLNRKLSSEEVLSAAKSWGLEEMLVPKTNCGKQCTDAAGNVLHTLDLPTFFNVFVPIVAAYTKTRWAKLFNDRDLYPLYKYEPLKLTQKNKIKSDIISDRIQRMGTEMGYRDDERQSILKTLLYSVCFNWPMEDWYSEKQTVLENGKETDIVVREGIRYAIPHASRLFYDQAHRVSTFNTDTGCEWGGYWEVVRFGEIANNPKYWNRESISSGYTRYQWPSSANWKIYHQLFPCRMKFPDVCSVTGQGAGDTDRLDRAFYSATSERDAGITLACLFQKLIPKEWGLYDYDKPVWHRFVMAGEDNVIHCVPLAYCPGVVYLYDYDHDRAVNTSLALEILPWQDHLGNLLTQYLLSVKRNLAKVIFWNTEILQQEDIDRIANLGEKTYRNFNFIPRSKQELGFQKQGVQDAFFPVEFPQANTQEISQAVTVMLTVMERMLGYSPQEIGASATHEQSATEVTILRANTTVRLDFTGGFIDGARHAKKRQLYDAMMAYSSDEVFAEIGDLNDAKRDVLKEMGFEVEENETDRQTKAGIKGPKKALLIDGFASDREGTTRISDAKLAATMVQTFQSIFSNPVLVQTMGAKQLVEMFNQILVFAGLPRDFRIRFEEKEAVSPEQQQEQATAVQQQIAAIASKVVEGQLGPLADQMREKVLMPIAQQQQQLGQAMEALLQQQAALAQKSGVQEEAIGRIMQVMQAAMGPPPGVAPPPMPLPLMPPQMMPPDVIPPGGIVPMGP